MSIASSRISAAAASSEIAAISRQWSAWRLILSVAGSRFGEFRLQRNRLAECCQRLIKLALTQERDPKVRMILRRIRIKRQSPAVMSDGRGHLTDAGQCSAKNSPPPRPIRAGLKRLPQK